MKNKRMLILGFAFLIFFALSIDCMAQNAKTLYLSSDEAIKLLTSTPRGKHKIIFQFYLDSSNDLTLYAWPKKRNNDENNDTDKIVLNIGTDKEIKLKNVLLGNLNIGKHRIDTILKALRNTTNQYKYIIFDPDTGKIQPKKEKIGLSTINHLYYTIYGTPNDVRLAVPFTKTRLTDTNNPSPPRQVN